MGKSCKTAKNPGPYSPCEPLRFNLCGMGRIFRRLLHRSFEGKSVERDSSGVGEGIPSRNPAYGGSVRPRLRAKAPRWNKYQVGNEKAKVHRGIQEFEAGLQRNDLAIAPSMVYAYAALKCDVPFVNATPNLCADIPALLQLAEAKRIPVAGKDLKTGQSFVKSVLASGLKARLLGLRGWFSTNILGNLDGEVLDHPMSFKTKQASKLSVLNHIVQPELYPELFRDFHHLVSVSYYPPRGDNKESW